MPSALAYSLNDVILAAIAGVMVGAALLTVVAVWVKRTETTDQRRER